MVVVSHSLVVCGLACVCWRHDIHTSRESCAIPQNDPDRCRQLDGNLKEEAPYRTGKTSQACAWNAPLVSPLRPLFCHCPTHIIATEYLDQFLASKPGWFERGSVSANMALLRSLSRLRLLRYVTNLNGNVVPATRMVRNWELRQERNQQASRETRCLHRQRQRRRAKAALRKGSVALDRHMESEVADESRKDAATARGGDKARVPMRPPPPRVVRQGTGYQTPLR